MPPGLEAGVEGTVSVGVLIVDDQAPFRRAAAKMVGRMDGFKVVGEAGSGEEGIALADALQPQLVLMDVRLPGIDGVEATRRILASRPDTVILLVSTYRAESLSPDLASCGAVGFLAKEEVGPDVLAGLCHPRTL
jgi:two-component system, NarL family, invasion response regulator UvrY